MTADQTGASRRDGPVPLAPDVALSRALDCEADLIEHGDTAKGAGYARQSDEVSRTCYQVMLELVRPYDEPVSLLDFGCGSARFLDHLRAAGHPDIRYTGLDLSQVALGMARRKHPDVPFLSLDVLADDRPLGGYDYIVMNGVLEWRGGLSRDGMLAYWKSLVSVLFGHCRIGLAFNTMSAHVDWQREDLFHLPFDTMAAFVTSSLTRHLVIRSDYGLYEYTTYLYRTPMSG